MNDNDTAISNHRQKQQQQQQVGGGDINGTIVINDFTDQQQHQQNQQQQKTDDQQCHSPSASSSSSSSSSASSAAHSDTSSQSFSARCSLRLHAVVARAYRRWAHFVVAHPYKIVFICFILTAICVVKMAKTKHKNNIRGYTPYGSRALYEFDVRDEFFDQSGVGIRFFVLILPRNGTNMMRMDTLRETVEVDELIQNNLTIYNRITQRDEPFSRICRRFCTINEPVRLFYDGFKDHQRRVAKHQQPSHNVQLDYPTSTVFGQRINIQPNFFGIHFANTTSSSEASSSNRFTNMDSVEMVVLLYRAERIGGWKDDDISDYEMSISNYFKDKYIGQHIRVLTISTSYVQVEVDRAGNIIRSYFGFGLAVMILCSLFSNSLSAFFMHQFSIYKLPVAIFACLCPFMASGTALGILFFAGVRHSSILAVTPFLILALGVDDAFLMIHSWQLASKRRRHEGGRAVMAHDALSVNLAVVDQLAEVLEDTGPAILISTLTNIFADLVGAFLGSEEITLLCIGNIASIIVDFFYQITLFTAVLVICARRELISARKRDNNKIHATNSNNLSEDDVKPTKSGGFRHSLERQFNAFKDIYICLALFKFEINLTLKKLFPPDSPLLEIEKYREEKVLPFYTTAQLFVNNPGDLSNATRRAHLNGLIDEMEHLKYAYPAESSLYFVRTYEEFLHGDSAGILDAAAEEENAKNGTATNEFDLSELETFLNWPEFRHWRGLIKYHHNTHQQQQSAGNGTELALATNRSDGTQLDSMMTTVAYHGDELQDWYNRALMLREWRQVVDKYVPEFNVSVLHDDGLYLDLLENMPINIWQSVVVTLLCMAAICGLFMCNMFVVFVTTCVIASIFIETLGIMALMDMTMDPVVMAAVTISIGFSVDMPAHVSYHFHAAKWAGTLGGKNAHGIADQSVEHKIRHAFTSVGFPALQASICTCICVLSLAFVKIYTAQVFVRVLCVCIVLCAVHSLFLLPALFTFLDAICKLFRQFMCQRR
ncbi:hypothetical protein niasHT_008713 [Heterodera trifolii]|uniref:SSD domain-containing protein n=1 Tax=Heterodera trifolii TaxID=157864 RepID=A0ABD2LTM7_9BILA